MRCIVKAILPIVAILGLLSPFSAAQARTGSFSCPGGQTIQSTLSSGASWSMCWEARDQEGVVLSDIRYQAPGKRSAVYLVKCPYHRFSAIMMTVPGLNFW